MNDTSTEHPKNQAEAYMADMHADVITLRHEVNNIINIMSMRIGITQDILSKELEQGRDTFTLYVDAANAHFSHTKSELKDIAAKELRQTISFSLIDAHKELYLTHQRRFPLQTVLLCVIPLISFVIGTVFGASFL